MSELRKKLQTVSFFLKVAYRFCAFGDFQLSLVLCIFVLLHQLTGGQQEGDKISIEILNPLEEYWSLHETYLKKAPKTTEVLFVGMNPSPKSLTGVYGESSYNAKPTDRIKIFHST